MTTNALKSWVKALMELFAVPSTNPLVKKWQLRRWMESLRMILTAREFSER